MLTQALNKTTQNQNLTEKEAYEVIDIITSGKAKPVQIAALLAVLKSKGESIEEITGFARSMRDKAVKVNTEGLNMVVDSCGTGGDCTNTFNISTASAIVAAATGLNVAKHSNVSITSNCGSSNVIEALRIPLLQSSEKVEESLKANSIAFIHAPYFHKSTFHVKEVRKDLGIRTIFNFLGPLTNPALPTGQVIGVPNTKIQPKIAEVLKNLGCKRALIVCGKDPVMDEISICGKTKVYELNNSQIKNYEISPEDFGLIQAGLKDIEGGSPEENARIIEDIFSGKEQGAKLDILLLNSAAVLWSGNQATSIKDGVNLAKQTIESGKAMNKLNQLRSS